MIRYKYLFRMYFRSILVQHTAYDVGCKLHTVHAKCALYMPKLLTVYCREIPLNNSISFYNTYVQMNLHMYKQYSIMAVNFSLVLKTKMLSSAIGRIRIHNRGSKFHIFTHCFLNASILT
jgi:hypothetical protein